MRAYYCTALVFVCAAVVSGGVFIWKSVAAQETAPPKVSHGNSIRLVDTVDSAKPLEERLQAKTTFQGRDGSLQHFAEDLGKALDAPVILATKQLEEAGINPQTPMTYNLRNVRMRTGLGLILL